MIKVENLTITSRQPILKAFSFNFEKDNIYQIMAENGAGKSTFLRALTQLVKYEGRIVYDNKSYKQSKEKVFFFEDNSWFSDDLNSLDYLDLTKKLWHSTHSITKEIEFWVIDEFRKLPIKKYSLGMKQKLIIAMYFVSDAPYLLMDEITNGLDQETREKFYFRLNELIDRNNKCIILTSHYANEIKKLHNLTTLKLENLSMNEVN